MKHLTSILFTLSLLLSACTESQDNQETASAEPWGIQLYTLRSMIGSPELYAQNRQRVLDSLSAYGFTKAELYGYENGQIFGIPAKLFVEDLRVKGITPVSSHVLNALTEKEIKTGNFDDKKEWWQQVIDEHKAIGVDTIVYVWYAFPNTMLELQRIAEYMEWIGAMCHERGICFGYHNHDHELKKVEGQAVMLDYLLEHTQPEHVFIEMDVYWTVYGNASPVAYFKKYPGRFKILHIKDQYEIGQSGMVGFDAIFDNLWLSGAEHLIIEQETTEQKDMLESLRISCNYLNDLFEPEPTPATPKKHVRRHRRHHHVRRFLRHVERKLH